MCYNSPAIVAETTRIARDVIGPAIKAGIDRLNASGKSHLYAGMIAGWETRLQDDSSKSANDSEPQYGFCALHNLGYSAQIALPAKLCRKAVLDDVRVADHADHRSLDGQARKSLNASSSRLMASSRIGRGVAKLKRSQVSPPGPN